MIPAFLLTPAKLGRLMLLAGLFLPVLAQSTPSITKYSDIAVGSIVPGATAGTVVLNSPSGTRTTTGGTSLGPSAGVTLGQLTLSGRKGDGWAISYGSAVPFSLTGPGGATLQASAVDFEPSATNTGTFPASGTTGYYYLGLTLSVGASGSTPGGIYSGSFSLRVRDTTNGRTSTTAFLVTARVDPAIALINQASLRFGDVFASQTAGTVVLTPSGLRSATGGASLGSTLPSGPATFSVTGAANAAYAIILPPSITLNAPGGSLTISPVTSAPGPTGLLNAAGQQTLAVGGTLNVGASQPEGAYAGTFNVTVAYN